MRRRSLVLILGLSAVALAPPSADAKGYKNCKMNHRFRPPLRTCDDPTPYVYKKPKRVKDKPLEVIQCRDCLR